MIMKKTVEFVLDQKYFTADVHLEPDGSRVISFLGDEDGERLRPSDYPEAVEEAAEKAFPSTAA